MSKKLSLKGLGRRHIFTEKVTKTNRHACHDDGGECRDPGPTLHKSRYSRNPWGRTTEELYASWATDSHVDIYLCIYAILNRYCDELFSTRGIFSLRVSSKTFSPNPPIMILLYILKIVLLH